MGWISRRYTWSTCLSERYRIVSARPRTCEGTKVIEVVYRSRCNERAASVERANEGETRVREIEGGGGEGDGAEPGSETA